MKKLTWQSIAQRDRFLAGAIAARGWEAWDETTAEQEADSVQLEGEAREKFLEGWHFTLDERERERTEQRSHAYDEEYEASYKKGDPAR